MKRIGNYPFTLSFMDFNEDLYGETLHAKQESVKEKFSQLFTKLNKEVRSIPDIHPISSPTLHCRQKCRFAIGPDPADTSGIKLAHLMWDGGGPNVIVDAFPVASIQIYSVMPLLIQLIHEKDEFSVLGANLSSVTYLSTQSEDLLISLIYGPAEAGEENTEVPAVEAEVGLPSLGLGDQWLSAATKLRDFLLSSGLPHIRSVSVIGRAKGIRELIGNDFVFETLYLEDGRQLRYKQVEKGFSNPNSAVNQRALSWLCGIATEINRNPVWVCSSTINDSGTGASTGVSAGGSIDLLEMYCGNGNHTVGLARKEVYFLVNKLFWFVSVFSCWSI
jgi:tRNA (uracil-5-)-methyltransferase